MAVVWRVVSGLVPVTLGGVDHLHVELYEEKGLGWLNSARSVLQCMTVICGRLCPTVKELVFWMPPIHGGAWTDFEDAAKGLPLTFFDPDSRPLLEGFALFIELPHKEAANHFQKSLHRAGRFSYKVMQPGVDDNMKWDVPLVITEGNRVGCRCVWEDEKLRDYMMQYFGEYSRISIELWFLNVRLT